MPRHTHRPKRRTREPQPYRVGRGASALRDALLAQRRAQPDHPRYVRTTP